jgi:hypothetical protein
VSSYGACNFSDTEVMEDLDVKDDFIAIKEELPLPIKQEEIPQGITFPDIKSEPDEVSYFCVCLLLVTFYLCPEISVFLFN